MQPKKKARGKPRSEADRLWNQQSGSLRVGVEHAFGGVKQFRIVHDIFRNPKKNFDDTVMTIACGLYNHRITGRLACQA